MDINFWYSSISLFSTLCARGEGGNKDLGDVFSQNILLKVGVVKIFGIIMLSCNSSMSSYTYIISCGFWLELVTVTFKTPEACEHAQNFNVL